MRSAGRWVLSTTFVLGVVAASLWLTRNGRTPAAPPRGLAWMGYLEINGLSQHVLIRGEDCRNPPLLWLHGGPGSAMTPLLRRYTGALEQHFTVIYWDQRGAGRTLRHAERSELHSLSQIVEDLDELLGQLQARFGLIRPWLVGHSWGSALAVLYGHRHPERIAGVIGVAQAASWPESDRLSYRFSLEEAQRRGDGRALKTLQGIGPPPWRSPWDAMRQRLILGRYMESSAPSALDQVWATLRQPEGSWLDVVNFLRGNFYSLGRVLDEVQALELRDHKRFDTPIIFLLGRHDRQLIPELAAAWHATIEAPRKEIVWFDAAHMIPLEVPGRFVAEVLRVTQHRVREL